MFKANDIRGIYNKDLDAETVYKIGFFLNKINGAEKIAVCRDVRLSSDEIFENLSKGIRDSGADVYDYGVTTTPESYYISYNKGYKITVMITASHNPPEYNGFKISREEAIPVGSENGLRELEAMVKGEEIIPCEKKGNEYKDDITDEYVAFMKSKLKGISSLNTVIDCSGGSASLIAKKIFGSKVSYIFDTPDGSFSKHSPNPMKEASRKALVAEVKSKKADVGIIFDGDADRVLFIDNKGRFVSPDLIINLLAYYLLDGKTREKVIVDIRSSKSCSYYIRDMGSTAIVWKVGHAFAKKRMREENAILGGELAGHYYLRDFHYCDSGVLAAIYVLNALRSLKKENIRFSDIIDEFTLFSHSGEINFTVEDKDGVMKKIEDHYKKENYLKFYDFDGIRFDFDEWWFNLRCSNTEQFVRLVVEADNADIMKKKIEEISKMITDE